MNKRKGTLFVQICLSLITNVFYSEVKKVATQGNVTIIFFPFNM